MDWITIFLLALVAAGAITTGWAMNEIRKLLAGTRPLPWTAITEIQQRAAGGDAAAIEEVERLLAERGPATVGDWLADQACAQILGCLLGSPAAAAGTPEDRLGGDRQEDPAPAAASSNGRAETGAHSSSLSASRPTPFPLTSGYQET